MHHVMFHAHGSRASVDQLVRRYTADAKIVVANDDHQAASMALSRMRSVAPDDLLNGLREVTYGFEQASSLQTQQLSNLKQLILGGALATLLVIALFIFWPSHRRTIKALDRLESNSAQLVAQNDELKHLRDAASHDADHDLLTGLLNRRGLENHLNSVLAGQCAANNNVALMHIDLDRFKQTNDTLGHAAGDFILEKIARLLRQHSSHSDVVARVGGDEFVLVAMDQANIDDLAGKAQTLIAAISQPMRFESNLCQIGASIGIDVHIAADVHKSLDWKQMLINADVALYNAKESGRGQHAFYSSALGREFQQTKDLSDAIVSGLDGHEFQPHYQVQVDAQTMQVVGLEALARWQHPQMGVVMPNTFIPMAESLNLMTKLDTKIMQAVAHQRSMWRQQGLIVPTVGVNLSSQSLNNAGFWCQFKELGLAPDEIALEITESVQLDDPSDQVMTNLLRLNAAGYRIEIDDFGTGRASLLSVQTIQPSRIKIAREVVQPLEETDDQRRVIEGIVSIAQAYGARVIAEGVETRCVADACRELGCHELQGYWFNRPETADVVTKHLEKSGVIVPLKSTGS